jgi:hypothetical protein
LVPRLTSIEFPPVLDEVAGSKLVVQLAGWVIVLRRPSEPEATRFFGRIGCCLDHLATVAFATKRRVDIQVWKGIRAVSTVGLGVKYGLSHTIEMHDLLFRPRCLVRVVVGDAEELVLVCGASQSKAVKVALGIDQSVECGLILSFWNGRFVEVDVSVEQT